MNVWRPTTTYRLVIGTCLIFLGACKEDTMTNASDAPDDIPVVTEQRRADGTFSIEIPDGVEPGTYPVRFVVKDANGTVTHEEVRYGPRLEADAPMSPEDEQVIRDIVRDLRKRGDPAALERDISKLEKIGVPARLLADPDHERSGK